MKKRILSVVLMTSLLVLSSAAGASAVVSIPPPNVDEMAVYINENFSGQSAIVSGSIYSAEGNIAFNSATDNAVSGNLYLRDDKDFIIPANYYPDFEDNVWYLSQTYFDEEFPAIAEFPEIDNYVASYTSPWSGPEPVIEMDTHYGTLQVNGPITIDVSEKDVAIVVDTLSFNGGAAAKLNVVGSNKLFLFIENYSGQGAVKIDNGNDPDKTFIVSKKSISHPSMNIYAHVFYGNTSSLNLTGTITGSVVTNATSLTLSGGGNVVNGLVYAPDAAAQVSSPDTRPIIPNITGRIVANSLSLTGKGNISYAPCDLVVPSLLLGIVTPQTYSVTVQSNIAEAGTVSPASFEAESGEVVHITATANEGYVFSSWNSTVPSMVPDGSGNVTVTQNAVITANFVSEIPPLDGYVNGLLGEYYDSSRLDEHGEDSLKVRRIDSNITFNGGYDTPPHTLIELETFSMRWTGFIRPTVSGSYTFKTYSDDGIKVFVNNTEVIDNWGLYSLDYSVSDTPIYLEAGTYYPITVEYQQMPLYAACILLWEANGVQTSIVPSSVFYVTEEVYNEYTPEQYYNPLEKAGTGFTNTFYTVDGNRNPDEIMHTEVNNIDYRWGWDAPENIGDDVFYGEMSGFLEAKYTEATTLLFSVDDGIKVWLEGNLVIDEWGPHSVEEFSYTFDAIAGHKYEIRIEYIDLGLGATCVMGWEGEALDNQIIPTTYMYTAL
ncbi:MAG: hypothetical protein EOM59_07970 [Clostridia bacterium]|nr:hypothetical protein [Clostridia bacterium]